MKFSDAAPWRTGQRSRSRNPLRRIPSEDDGAAGETESAGLVLNGVGPSGKGITFTGDGSIYLMPDVSNGIATYSVYLMDRVGALLLNWGKVAF